MNETEMYDFERRTNAARAAKGKPPVAEHGPFAHPPSRGIPRDVKRTLESSSFLLFVALYRLKLRNEEAAKKPYEKPVLRVNRPEDFNRFYSCGLGQEFYAKRDLLMAGKDATQKGVCRNDTTGDGECPYCIHRGGCEFVGGPFS